MSNLLDNVGGDLAESAAEGFAEGVDMALQETMTDKSKATRYITRALVLLGGVGGGTWMTVSGFGSMANDPDKAKALIFLGIVLGIGSIISVVRSIIKRKREKHD